MHLTWRSCQGWQRRTNNDAMAYTRKQDVLLCMLVDAAEKSINSQSFARYWAETVIQALICEPCTDSDAMVLGILENEHRRLRESFLHEVASYALLTLDANSGAARGFYVGDCLIGHVTDTAPAWWYQPDTLDIACGGGSEDNRHTLTRSLKARRYTPPKVVTRDVASGDTLILATDGYWAECLIEGGTFGTTQDDASYLTVKVGEWAFTTSSRSNNSVCVEQPGAAPTKQLSSKVQLV